MEFHIWGKVVNNSGGPQRITTLIPIVYDADGESIDAESMSSLLDYDELRETISLDPEQSLAFSFVVFLPDEVAFEEDYEIVVETELAEPARDDLKITFDESDLSEWPSYYVVAGTYENPGPDLSEYIVLIVTVYDVDAHVIGVGSFYETDTMFLGTGEHEFLVDVEMWANVDGLELEVETYETQIFGY